MDQNLPDDPDAADLQAAVDTLRRLGDEDPLAELRDLGTEHSRTPEEARHILVGIRRRLRERSAQADSALDVLAMWIGPRLAAALDSPPSADTPAKPARSSAAGLSPVLWLPGRSGAHSVATCSCR